MISSKQKDNLSESVNKIVDSFIEGVLANNPKLEEAKTLVEKIKTFNDSCNEKSVHLQALEKELDNVNKRFTEREHDFEALELTIKDLNLKLGALLEEKKIKQKESEELKAEISKILVQKKEVLELHNKKMEFEIKGITEEKERIGNAQRALEKKNEFHINVKNHLKEVVSLLITNTPDQNQAKKFKNILSMLDK